MVGELVHTKYGHAVILKKLDDRFYEVLMIDRNCGRKMIVKSENIKFLEYPNEENN